MTRRKWVMYLESVPFTEAVITGKASLGGSESAAIGMMRALAARGHDVQCFATRLEKPGEYDGVIWHRAESDLGPALSFITPDVFIALRLPTPYVQFTIPGNLNVLWNEDLLVDPQTVSTFSQVDQLWYVSEYHRRQWEGVDSICGKMPSYVTRNGVDPAHYPVQVWPGGASWADGVTVTRDPHRYIYISRPERALRPLLELWPEIRKADPQAVLGICRYQSMYDGEGSRVQQMVDSYDRLARQVAQDVGGIEWLGQLAKRPLAEAIARSRAMLYPGVADFAETSCWVPSTPVAVPGGFKRIDQVKAGDLVMSYDERAKRIVSKRVKWCKRTGINRAVSTLTYKWRFGRGANRVESITGTPDHRMLRRDGTWTTLGELRPGDSLMPMFRTRDAHYTMVGHDGTNRRYEHDIVGEALVGGALNGRVVHHRDGDGFNNAEDNLEVIWQSDHARRHDIHSHRPPAIALDLEAMHAMRRSGLSQAAIAAQMGTTQATVSRRLRASNHAVVSVEPAGFSDVWDMEVDDTHTFIAGHVVAHNCIAAIESQQCGTPLIASWRGALPETLHPDAGILIAGSPDDDAYRADFCAAVAHVRNLSDAGYQALQDAGRRHAKSYSFDTIAAEWESHVEATFAARYAAHKPAILRNLLHWDRHVMGREVAKDIVADGFAAGPNVNALEMTRASEAVELCNIVIRGEHQQAEDYAAHALPDPIFERDNNNRFDAIVKAVQAKGVQPARILDLACGNGSLVLKLAQAFPSAHIRGIDYSPGVLDIARHGAITAEVSDRVQFAQAGFPHFAPATDGEPYDLVTCGEFIEHVEHPDQLINAMEQLVTPDGLCVFTTPCGPFAELLDDMANRKRGHLHAFSHQQISRLLQGRQWHLDHLSIGMSQRGTPMGYWIVTWRPNPAQPVQPVDWRADILATRPYQSVVGMMIVKDGAEWLRKCLGSLGCLDTIVVHDTGSKDESRDICRKFGAEVIDVDWPDSFAAARNRVLKDCEARGADWVLWIDADEHLEHGERLRRYTSGAGPYLGYVIRQNHLMLDSPVFHDKPARLFRAGKGVRFFGAIHEQPETAPDAGVWPSLELPDLDIIHLGYHRDSARRRKLLTRNLPMLQQQLQAPEGERRRLDFVLFVRDCANIAQFELERTRGQMTQKGARHAEAGVAAYQQHFSDPADKYHSLARPFYETCLQMLGRGFEIGWGLAAGQPKLDGKLAPEKFRVADLAEAERELAARMASILRPFQPAVIDTLPCVRRTGHGGLA